MTLCSVDWDTISKDYDVEECTQYGEYWVFDSDIGAMNPYLEYWAEKKKAAPKGSVERQQAKNMMNMCYGRFALKPDLEVVTLGEDEEGLPAWITDIEKGEPTAFLPMGIFICAWARSELMNRVRMVAERYGIDSLIHSDTDSVIYKGEPIGGYGKNIGDWDIECLPSRIIEGGFKRYVEIFDDREGMARYNVTCAGVPQPKRMDGTPKGMWIEILDEPMRVLGGVLGDEHYTVKTEWLRKLLLDNGHDPDDQNTLKLIPRKVPGGVILDGHTHQLDDGLKVRLFRNQ